VEAQFEQRKSKRLSLFWSFVGLVALLTLLFQLSQTIAMFAQVADQTVQTVLITSSAFDPAEVTVPRSTTVEWVNQDSITHTVASQTGLWDSGDIAPGGVYSRTFEIAGSYPYSCTYHPSMTGTVIVVANTYLPIVAKNLPLAAPTAIPTLTPVGPRPGRWEGQGTFDGSFRVEPDRTRITNFEGSFWTPLCGDIDVPGDLTPPEEIEISDNTFHLLLNIPDTLTFLRIDGTFNTETSVEGDYSWGVDGCGFGGRIDWSASWQGD
jgi:plastocyanin